MATISIPQNYFFHLIASAAGQPDPSACTYLLATNTLNVNGVTQEALDNALATYNHDLVVLTMEKQQAKKKIDNYAGKTRLKFVTSIIGQELTYQEKTLEAERFVANGYPNELNDYPYIEAEMLASGVSKEEAAATIISNNNHWKILNATIEKFRLSGKKMVDTATTTEEVNTIVNNTITSMNGVN